MHPAVRTVELDTIRIAPVVLSCSLFNAGTTFTQGFRLETRHVYDYELEYYLYSTGGMHIEGKDWPLAKGDVCLRRPGEHVGGIMPYNCILICFDVTGDAGKQPGGYDFNEPQSFSPRYRNAVLDALPSVMHPRGEAVGALFESILRFYLASGDSAQLQMKACMLQLLNRLFLEARFPLGEGLEPPQAEAVRLVLAHIRDHLADPLPLEKLAAMARMSPAHFHKVFGAIVHEPLNRHVTRLRMDKARECLVQTDWPVHRVAAACGYANPSHFGWLFRRWVGMTPGEYKRRHRYA